MTSRSWWYSPADVSRRDLPCRFGLAPSVEVPRARIQEVDHLTRSERFEVDQTTAEARAADYDMLVSPGGVANFDRLRIDDAALVAVRPTTSPPSAR